MMKKIVLLGIMLFSLFSSLYAQDFYWESPEPLYSGDSRFPIVASLDGRAAVVWQELDSVSAEGGRIWLSIRYFDGVSWHENRRFAGPIPYAGEVPSIASLALASESRVFIPVAAGENRIYVYSSADGCRNFERTVLNGSSSSVLSPHLFERSDGGFFIFASKGGEENFSLVVSRSDDGSSWSSFSDFSATSALRRPFLPVHAAVSGRDVVVFQAFYEGSARPSYQLYSTYSDDAGLTWSEPVLFTDFGEAGSQDAVAGRFENFHNQRPSVMSFGGKLSLVWERARTASQRYSIFYAELDSRGMLANQAERISSADGYCYDPQIAEYQGLPAVVWYDNRKGSNRVYLALKDGYLWSERELSRESRDSVFGRVVSVSGALEVYWQQAVARGGSRVYRLSSDQTVSPPRLVPAGFRDKRKGRGDRISVTVDLPEDSSGIAGFNWAYSSNTPGFVPNMLSRLPEDTRITVEAPTDGSWFIGARAMDYAGNWSQPSWVEYIRDTTPPAPPVIAEFDIDGSGYVSSNSFKARWDPAEDDDIQGYSWRLEYVAPLEYLPVLQRRWSANAAFPASAQSASPVSFDFQQAASRFLPSPRPASSVRTADRSVSFTNRDNGIYAVSVSAIDSVGNIGAPAVKYIVLNKYIPYTYITYIDSKVDETGIITLSIIGRGFTEGGKLQQIHFDRDGMLPWDVTLAPGSNRFAVVNDRLVSGIVLSELEEGSYRVALDHPRRGLYLSKPLLSVSEYGTVKFGSYDYEFTPPWTKAPLAGRSFPGAERLSFYALLFFAAVVFIFSFYGISRTAHDSLLVRQEIRALLTGDIMPSEKKKRSVALRKKGVSLRFKLAFFTTSLVISVVLVVSIPLGLQFSENQEKTLALGLQERVNVLLESLASGARAYLPSQNLLELGFLPSQVSALEEALHSTITGRKSDGSSTGIDYVWATNDPAIDSKIDSAALTYGASMLVDPDAFEISSRVSVLEVEARRAVGELAEGISALSQEGVRLALNTDAASAERRSEIQTITRQLEEKLTTELSRIAAAGTGSWPPYDPSQLSRDVTLYSFFKPVMYRQGGSDSFVHGIVRVDVSTESLLETVLQDRQALVRTTVYVALFAVLIGVIGSLLLASIIISPVRRLASHVAMIRDTEDKETLEGKNIHLRSRDEIGLLGDTINEMTHGLVKAAAASKDLTVGKEVQKMFIPLETDSNGRKLTCGRSDEPLADFFGYYEGAKGVSGDYFDYIKLDDRHYAIIKCDVAGKGVPAALIMVEVATLFLDYFTDWKYEKNGYKLSPMVSRINDLIESRGFKGRFAAFTLCILDSKSGNVHFCNAGDNLVHVYEARSRKMKTIALHESSAAGVFPSFMVDMKGGFQVETIKLNSGDILFLYTDGIEEAKRLFRTSDLKVHACAEPGLEQDAPHGSHSVGQDNEELGPERVSEIIEAVFSRKMYTLYKWHNPDPSEIFEFDFTSCEGTVEEAILALVSVEKIFRMYKDPLATDFDRVQVDRKVDLFLNRHFRQYGSFCGNRKDHPEYPEYLYYTNIREDSQYDDLTILGVKKK